MIIGVCSAELMESLDSSPKTMAHPVNAETIAIAQHPCPHPYLVQEQGGFCYK